MTRLEIAAAAIRGMLASGCGIACPSSQSGTWNGTAIAKEALSIADALRLEDERTRGEADTLLAEAGAPVPMADDLAQRFMRAAIHGTPNVILALPGKKSHVFREAVITRGGSRWVKRINGCSAHPIEGESPESVIRAALDWLEEKQSE